METGILEILNNIQLRTKKIDVKELPTQGYFYPKDFSIYIKKASFEDTIEYNFNYVKDDLAVILYETKKIIRRNIILTNNYTYNDIKSNDLLYIFFEIVKFTMNKDIKVPHRLLHATTYISFDKNTFNYFDYFSLGGIYNEDTREFERDGYRFSLPSVGAENCIIEYIYQKDLLGEDNDFNYDFLFFLGNKDNLTFEEVDNLVTIFNEDINDKETEIIRNIVLDLSSAISYSLKYENKLVGLDLKIDFEKLFI